MSTSTYRELLGIPAVRRILVMGTLVRIPLWAASVVLVLHVVTYLDHSYAAAGIVGLVFAVALGISNPWRGRRLDRVGLRATLTPSLVVLTACWALAPWVSYVPLLVLVAVAGLFEIPHFSVVRLVLIGAAGERRRTAVLAIDSVVVEVSFMIGPVLGVFLATWLPTPWALLLTQALSIAGAGWLWLVNPSLADPEAPVEPEDAPVEAASRSGVPGPHRPRRLPRLRRPGWLTAGVAAVLLVAMAATVVLNAQDLSTVAALRSMGHTAAIGWVLALWGLGSALGGTVYGTLSRHPPSYVLMALLAGTSLLVPLGQHPLVFAGLMFLTGVFCAPTITATIDDLSRLVSARVRGEAMGWHGSALTLGGAVGSPLTGLAIDRWGWGAGFETGGVVGLVVAGIAVLALAYSRRPPRPGIPVAGPAGGASAARDAVAARGLGDSAGDGRSDPLVEG